MTPITAVRIAFFIASSPQKSISLDADLATIRPSCPPVGRSPNSWKLSCLRPPAIRFSVRPLTTRDRGDGFGTGRFEGIGSAKRLSDCGTAVPGLASDAKSRRLVVRDDFD
jgi:hypothetical protein